MGHYANEEDMLAGMAEYEAEQAWADEQYALYCMEREYEQMCRNGREDYDV